MPDQDFTVDEDIEIDVEDSEDYLAPGFDPVRDCRPVPTMREITRQEVLRISLCKLSTKVLAHLKELVAMDSHMAQYVVNSAIEAKYRRTRRQAEKFRDAEKDLYELL